MFLVNSRYPLVTATFLRSRCYSFTQRRHTFFRSYGANLPSSLASILSRALGYSPRPPESVCGTVTTGAPHAAFLGSMESLSSGPGGPPHHVSELSSRLWLSPPTSSSYTLEPAIPNSWLSLSFSVPAWFNTVSGGAGILTSFPSPTPFGLSLGAD